MKDGWSERCCVCASHIPRRPELHRVFHLEPWGGSPLVTKPGTPWRGGPNDATGQETTVLLQALGNLADTLVLDLAETWRDRQALEPVGATNGLRRNYLYTRAIP